MAAERRPVTATGRAGQGGARPQGRHVVDGGPGQGKEGLEIQSDGGGDPLHLAEQCHHVVGRDAGGGVVRGPVAVGHLDQASAEAGHHVPGQGCTGHGKGHARAEPGGTDLAVGERHQRVHGRPQRMGRQCVEPERPGEVGHGGARRGNDRRRHVGHGVVGGGDDEQVDTVGGARQRVVAPEEPGEGPAARRQRGGQGRAGPTGTDDPDGVHLLTSFGVPAPCGCRSPTDDRR